MKDETQDESETELVKPSHHEQPWREERGQPEPKGIEGLHAGQSVPDHLQRETMPDTGVGSMSRVEGDTEGNENEEGEGGLVSGSNFGTGHGSQGPTDRGPFGPGSAHATGQGRDTEGAFGEENPASNPSPLSDFRDEAISKRET